MLNTIQLAEALFNANLNPLPLQPYTKKPKGTDGYGKDWPNISFNSLEELRSSFQPSDNIGLLLDETDVVIDLDAVNIANDYGLRLLSLFAIPVDTNVIGRNKKPAGAVILKTDANSKYFETTNHAGNQLVELLVKGKQKVLPPSMFKENEVIDTFTWKADFRPNLNFVPFKILKEAAVLVSVFSLLDAAYPEEGQRDEACRNTAYIFGKSPLFQNSAFLNENFANTFINSLIEKNGDGERVRKQWTKQYNRDKDIDSPVGLLLAKYKSLHKKDAEQIVRWLEYTEVKEEAQPEPTYDFNISPVSALREATAKEREWLIQGLVQRGTYSQIHGSGGAGKSILGMQIAIMATNKESYLCDLFKFVKDCRVLVINNEDPQDEIDRRALAILKRLNTPLLDEKKVDYRLDNVFIKSFLNQPLKLLDKENGRLKLRPKAIEGIQDFISDKKIDLVMLDPLISFHNAEENLNKDMDMFIREAVIAPLASKSNTGVLGNHHVAKGTSNNDQDIEGNTNASRGASAITNAARSVIRVAGMNLSMAQRIWTDWKKDPSLLEKRHDYVQLAFGKINNARATDGNWMYKHPVEFRNEAGQLIDSICLRRDYSIENLAMDAEKVKKKEDDKRRLEVIQTLEKQNLIDVGDQKDIISLMDVARCLEEHNDKYVEIISRKDVSGKTGAESYRKSETAIASHLEKLFAHEFEYQDKVFQYVNKKVVSGNQKRWLTMEPKPVKVPEGLMTETFEEDAEGGLSSTTPEEDKERWND